MKFVGREREYKRDWERARKPPRPPYPCGRPGCETLISFTGIGGGRPAIYCSPTCRRAAKKRRRPTPAPSRSRVCLPKNPTLGDIRAVVQVDESSACWIWPTLGRDGYARYGARSLVHRLVATLVHGDLGGQPVHHTCGRRGCVNPDHLQVVTHAANNVEMLERTWYRKHIRDLRAALAEWSPMHPLLDVAWPDEG